MNCFNHPDVPAVGLCKSCGKGLCRECLVEIENGLACRDSCEERATYINRVIDSNRKVLAAARYQQRNAAWLILIVGVAFIVVSTFLYTLTQSGVALGLIALGVVVLVFSLLWLRKKVAIPTMDDNPVGAPHHKD